MYSGLSKFSRIAVALYEMLRNFSYVISRRVNHQSFVYGNSGKCFTQLYHKIIKHCHIEVAPNGRLVFFFTWRCSLLFLSILVYTGDDYNQFLESNAKESTPAKCSSLMMLRSRLRYITLTFTEFIEETNLSRPPISKKVKKKILLENVQNPFQHFSRDYLHDSMQRIHKVFPYVIFFLVEGLNWNILRIRCLLPKYKLGVHFVISALWG